MLGRHESCPHCEAPLGTSNSCLENFSCALLVLLDLAMLWGGYWYLFGPARVSGVLTRIAIVAVAALVVIFHLWAARRSRRR